MKYRVGRFQVRAGETDAVDQAIIAWVAKVADEPGTLRFESFREPDGVSYVNVMVFADDEAEAAHDGSPSKQQFLSVLLPRCTSRPVYTQLKKISGAGR